MAMEHFEDPFEIGPDLLQLLNTEFGNEGAAFPPDGELGTYGNSDSSEAGSDDEDADHSRLAPAPANEQDFEDGGFGDEEQIYIASDSHRWKIDHTKGEHRLAGMRSSRLTGRESANRCSRAIHRKGERPRLQRRAGHRHAAETIHDGLREQEGRIQSGAGER